MPRTARIVVPGLPHHVTARGNRREPIFFEFGDPERYRRTLAEEVRRCGVEVWAYCFMPNHVHLILVPETADGLSRALGEAHRRWSGFVNTRAGWTGRLFEDRFSSVVMDEHHLAAAFRYVGQNPVRAGLVARPQDWAWSSVRSHLGGIDDELVEVRHLIERVVDVSTFLDAQDERSFEHLRAAERHGRPLGPPEFVADLERRLGRSVSRKRTTPGTGTDFRGAEIGSSPLR